MTATVKLAREWRELYAKERAALGEAGMFALLDRAPPVDLPQGGALVFPHTHLHASGHLVAAAARAVVRSGCDQVLALGVLHNARERDAPLLERARAGEPAALTELRRVHGPGVAGDAGHWAEEYSLDGFTALLEVAARRERRAPPHLVVRFPFLVGDDPSTLPGLGELLRLRDSGCAIVATADPIHHGVAYGTPEAERRAREDPATKAWARAALDGQHALLAKGNYAAFLTEAAKYRSDFRDAGPVLAMLRGGGTASVAMRVRAIELVDYAETFGEAAPTWVAAALTELSTTPAS